MCWRANGLIIAQEFGSQSRVGGRGIIVTKLLDIDFSSTSNKNVFMLSKDSVSVPNLNASV